MQTSTITQTTISVTITSIPAQTVNISIYTIIICYKQWETGKKKEYGRR